MEGAVSDHPPLREEREEHGCREGGKDKKGFKRPWRSIYAFVRPGKKTSDRKRMRNDKHPLCACHLSEHMGSHSC